MRRRFAAGLRKFEDVYLRRSTRFTAPGIEVRRPGFAHLLAMKLGAWRDELDISDAKRILREMSGSREEVWNSVAPYLTPGRELKARYAHRQYGAFDISLAEVSLSGSQRALSRGTACWCRFRPEPLA